MQYFAIVSYVDAGQMLSSSRSLDDGSPGHLLWLPDGAEVTSVVPLPAPDLGPQGIRLLFVYRLATAAECEPARHFEDVEVEVLREVGDAFEAVIRALRT